jgi:hypothetical protein
MVAMAHSRGWAANASVFMPSPQASPIIPRNASADSPMAACITYELPGSLLKLICDEGVCAISSLQRVMLPSVSKLAATAELHFCRGGVGMFCE